MNFGGPYQISVKGVRIEVFSLCDGLVQLTALEQRLPTLPPPPDSTAAAAAKDGTSTSPALLPRDDAPLFQQGNR